MNQIAIGLAVLLAVAIIAIGLQYIFAQQTTVRMFGLPLPDSGANTAWWLRLKGVRDIASGLTVLSMLIWASPREMGIILLAESFIALGDMSMILAAKGSTARAYGMHGVTALVMIVVGIVLVLGVH